MQNMGQINNTSNSQPKFFIDGDIPRDTMSMRCGERNGWAYYNISLEGNCNMCGTKTQMWLVGISIKGNFQCIECRKKNSCDNEINSM